MVCGKCQKCKPYLCTMKSFFQATVSSVSRVQFTIERVYKRSCKTKLADFSEIIHQKLPLFDKIPLLKLRKTRLSLKFLEQKEFVCKTWNRTQSFVFSFARRKHSNGFRRLKNIYNESLCSILSKTLGVILSTSAI